MRNVARTAAVANGISMDRFFFARSESNRYAALCASNGSFAASHAAMPPAISLTRVNPWRCSRLAAIDER